MLTLRAVGDTFPSAGDWTADAASLGGWGAPGGTGAPPAYGVARLQSQSGSIPTGRSATGPHPDRCRSSTQTHSALLSSQRSARHPATLVTPVGDWGSRRHQQISPSPMNLFVANQRGCFQPGRLAIPHHSTSTTHVGDLVTHSPRVGYRPAASMARSPARHISGSNWLRLRHRRGRGCRLSSDPPFPLRRTDGATGSGRNRTPDLTSRHLCGPRRQVAGSARRVA